MGLLVMSGWRCSPAFKSSAFKALCAARFGQAAKSLAIWSLTMLLLPVGNVTAADARALQLRDQYAALGDALDKNQFKRPLTLQSREASSSLEGDMYARLDYPFSTVIAALNDPVKGPGNWCDVLILHLNTKFCRALPMQANGSTTLKVNIGKKVEQSLDDAYPVEFEYRSIDSSPDYFQVELVAANGPLSTKDYRIVVEAVALDANHTFLHFKYSYSYGMAGQLAMKTYLATIGRDKVGFTRLDDQAAGKAPQYIRGIRGVVERNTMRYYLAIDAYLGALAAPPAARLEKRLQAWFSATEQYSRQLHEVEREEYMDMKYKEYQRQQSAL